MIPRRLIRTRRRSSLGFTVSVLFCSLQFIPAHGRLDWAQHGICGRGVFLDVANYFTEGGRKPLPYDPWSTHAITVKDLEACAYEQGVTFRQGDILIVRVGWMQKWYASTSEVRDGLANEEATAYVFFVSLVRQ